ncbi:hypothetical protein P4518_01430 [Geobacillus thermodenitrificans]|uniref:hypothetical protein n=1 Tax=Geobacillus thermodenitrificans TaxID=33940 RepID=UPI002E225C31|nr:hypothetical protein [Geobacillus thermodenitrificans]
MRDNIRAIIRRHQEEQALRQYLGERYDTTPDEEKRRFLNAVNDIIEREVDSILRAFVEEAQIGSPERKRRRRQNILNLVVTLICTPAIGYAVNIENWIIVGFFSLVLLAVQLYLLFSE